MKFFSSLAAVNERIGDPFLYVYHKIAMDCPDYMPAHKAFYEAMHKQNHQLVMVEGVTLPSLAVLFNESADVNTFMQKLYETKQTNIEEFNKYNDVIAKQS